MIFDFRRYDILTCILCKISSRRILCCDDVRIKVLQYNGSVELFCSSVDLNALYGADFLNRVALC